ncbi:hypothetical protein Back2_03850 [Nocardioides baekrokdamisoli]|uniref:DUF4328 domain-containing protein n=1 Tax=Nocardioides baekrokdamisoli TaxID=1804624 RepID=A0A3G9IXT0_9ACTN|nr:DUF4328 domain-containing protein [Nocardioides baekrokdamisoli]BBH16098.1 hypothetical protein Back2_03850 [Nocardioides baekrokdamisoli]
MSDLPIAPPLPPPSPADRIPDRPSSAIRGLAGAITVLVALIAVVNVVLLGVHWWGNGGFLNEVRQGSPAAYDDAKWYDDIRRMLGNAELVGWLVAGILWCVWQVKIAKATPAGELRRSPGWHAGSWFIPIGNLWMPFQNMRDLWSHWVSRTSAALLGWWWGVWLLSSQLGRVLLSEKVKVGDLGTFRSFNRIAIAVCGVEIVASLLAIVVVSQLTRAVFEQNAKEDGTIGAWPES